MSCQLRRRSLGGTGLPLHPPLHFKSGSGLGPPQFVVLHVHHGILLCPKLPTSYNMPMKLGDSRVSCNTVKQACEKQPRHHGFCEVASSFDKLNSMGLRILRDAARCSISLHLLSVLCFSLIWGHLGDSNLCFPLRLHILVPQRNLWHLECLSGSKGRSEYGRKITGSSGLSGPGKECLGTSELGRILKQSMVRGQTFAIWLSLMAIYDCNIAILLVHIASTLTRIG